MKDNTVATKIKIKITAHYILNKIPAFCIFISERFVMLN